MNGIRVTVKNIISISLLYGKTNICPQYSVSSVFLCETVTNRAKFVRSVSTCNILFGRKLDTADELEIEDYERTIIDEEEEDQTSINRKFVDVEGENINLPDKIPLVRDYKKVAVLLPWVKWGPKKRHNMDPELLLNEACALINSIPSMEIVYKEKVNLAKMIRNQIFTTGTMERLVIEINMIECDAVFISLNYLKKREIIVLEELFRKRIFDRYMVVLDIFKYHSVSFESKVQIKLAEMPYINRGIITNDQKMWSHANKRLLEEKLQKLSDYRKERRLKRKQLSRDYIAVIGYTNCGKTTFIRGITSDTRLVGENRLFATVDVTSHSTVLPCGLSSYFVDTVGFIQDIPINLIAAFRSTLQDAIYADVIVYMRDLSHPDFLCQHKTVKDVLDTMPIPESTPIIVVNSKCDVLTEKELEESKYEYDLDGSHNVSAVTGEGMFHLLRVIESKLLEVTGRKKYRLNLPSGSAKIDWLRSNIGLQEEEINQDDINFTLVTVAMNVTEIRAYRTKFKS